MRHLKNEADLTQNRVLNRGLGQVPFPQARPARALREEDAYYEKYGGSYRWEAFLVGLRTLHDRTLSVIKTRKPRLPSAQSETGKVE